VGDCDRVASVVLGQEPARPRPCSGQDMEIPGNLVDPRRPLGPARAGRRALDEVAVLAAFELTRGRFGRFIHFRSGASLSPGYHLVERLLRQEPGLDCLTVSAAFAVSGQSVLGPRLQRARQPPGDEPGVCVRHVDCESPCFPPQNYLPSRG